MSTKQQLLTRIERREALVGVVGLGYVGLPLATAFAEGGFRVLGFDVAQGVVDGINAGRSHIKDVPSSALAAFTSDGRITATTDFERLGECDAISVCVPTPLSKTRDPDVSYVVSATEAVGRTLRRGQLVVLESTTYPGTTRELMLPRLEAAGLRCGEDFFLCFSPERVDPGNATWHVQNTPKVIGGVEEASRDVGVALYSRVMEHVVPVSSTESAELTKLLENTFRAVNIAMVNEMAQVCSLLDVDIWEVIDAAATKPFGFMRFTPGPGIGGHCIPLDPHYLSWKMKTLAYKTRMIEQASEINSEMPRFVVDKVQDALNWHRKSVRGSRILVLGVAYKKDIDDLRESPALDLIRLLEERGAEVEFHDPYVAVVREDGEERRSVPLDDARLHACDCVVIATDHTDVDYRRVVSEAPLVVDTRNATRGIESDRIVTLSGASLRLRAAAAERTAEVTR